MVAEEQAASTDAVRAELARIVGSPHFDASERNRGFLTYVVEEALAGRGDRIKAYAIATEVFGRDPKFDPQLDSIVRIEAGRLRRSLERYYLTDGRASRLRIDIPRGGYTPTFGTAHAAIAPPAHASVPGVLVTAFEEEGDQTAFPSFTRGFTRSLVIALSHLDGLRVFGAEGALRRPGDLDGRASSPEFAPDYLVTGQTALLPDGFEIGVLLVEAASGRVVWAETFERRAPASAIIALRNELAVHVARALAPPCGAVAPDRAPEAEGRAAEPFGSYAAVLLFHADWRTFDRESIAAVHLALERTIAAEPDHAEALACLSLVHSNAFRFGHPIDPADPEPRRRALALATRATVLAPSSSWAHYALGLARWFVGDVAGALAALETGRRLNPNDVTILAELGQRYAMLARWDDAALLLDEALSKSPSQPGSFRFGLFLLHFAQGRHAEALAQARRVDAAQVLFCHVAVAAAAGELGLADEAAEAVAAIRALDPDYGARVVADLESRHVAPQLVPLIAAGLAKAGLAIPATAAERASA